MILTALGLTAKVAKYCINISQAAKLELDSGGDNHHFKGQTSYVRFGAVQFSQRGRSEQPLPLAEGLCSTLVGSQGATGQRLGADSQFPGCIRSVWG